LAKNSEKFAQSQQHLELWLKGSIARDLWERTDLFRIVNRGNPIFLMALEEIKKLN